MSQIFPANRLSLRATLMERDAMRYTPAGIPIVGGRIRHASKQTEAGIERIVELEVGVIAAGEIAGRFDRAVLGTEYLFAGFLAPRSRNSKALVFHITEFGNIT